MLKKSVHAKTKDLKPFEFGDIIVYSLTLLLVAVLFLFLVVFPKSNHVSGFKVTVSGNEVFTYYTASDKYVIKELNGYVVEVDNTDGNYLLTVSSNDGHYNKILLDTANESAKVVESNCSLSKDCTFSPAITDSGAIICAPHSLKIVPILSDGSTEPITG